MGHGEAVFKVGSVGVRWLFASKCGIASEAVIRIQVGYEAASEARRNYAIIFAMNTLKARFSSN